jgi:Fur family transcriptional regulator, zinc uptake regulator
MPAARDLSPTQLRVLDLLAKAGKPLSAYDLLGQLRSEGVNAPPTVYRALDKLIAHGLAHRIESLNAFVACHAPHHSEMAAFAICDHCGKVEEITDKAVEVAFAGMAKGRGFHASRMNVEMHGHCADCAAHAHGHDH